MAIDSQSDFFGTCWSELRSQLGFQTFLMVFIVLNVTFNLTW